MAADSCVTAGDAGAPFDPPLAQMAGLDAVYGDVEAPNAGGLASVRSDHFANFTAPSPAVREYLKLRGERGGATTVDAIYEALVRGGYDFKASAGDAKNGLNFGRTKIARTTTVTSDMTKIAAG